MKNNRKIEQNNKKSAREKTCKKNKIMKREFKNNGGEDLSLKELFYKDTNGGEDYFIKEHPDLYETKTTDGRYGVVCNHHRNESKPSFTIYESKGIFYSKDFSVAKWSGDAFYHYNLVHHNGKKADFRQILKEIYEYTLGKPAPPFKESGGRFLEKVQPLKDDVEFKIKLRSFDKLKTNEKDFMEKHGWTTEVMTSYNVQFVKSYIFKAKDKDHFWKRTLKENEVIMATIFKDCYRLYHPMVEKSEFKHSWRPKGPGSYVFGLHIVEELYHKYYELYKKQQEFKKYRKIKNQTQVVFCAGEKDTLSLRSLGFNSICLQSESSTFLPQDLKILLMDLNQFCTDGFDLVILYDRDKAGKSNAKSLKQKIEEYCKFEPRIVKLPKKIKSIEGKDVSDWVISDLENDELVELLKPVYED